MLTQKQFDARLQAIEDQAAARQERVTGYRDQSLAKLFVDSGWSQEDLAEHLAKKWGRSVTRQEVGYHLRFGRFITFFATACCEDSFRLPPNFTEGTFRSWWNATEASANFSGHKANSQAAVEDEQRRFGLVLDELKSAGLSRKRRAVRKAIIKKLVDKSPKSVEQIKEIIRTEFATPVVATDDVTACLKTLHPTPEEPFRVEKCVDADGTKYRVVKAKSKPPSSKELAKLTPELLPMIREMIIEAKKEKVLISCSTLCSLASRIEKVLESIVGEVTVE